MESTQPQQVLTEGEIRVRTNFNVSNNDTVAKVKGLLADAINLLAQDQNEVASMFYDDTNERTFRAISSDYQREVATAKTAIEDASMWATKALTNVIHTAKKPVESKTPNSNE